MSGSGRRIAVMLPRDLPPQRVIPFARRAEELGFAEVWVVEDLGFRGGIAQAAAVLAATERIHVGIGLMPVGARNVAFAAMELATLCELFPGRVSAGVGHGMPGWMRSVGAWPASPLGLLEECVVALKALLRGETVSVQGRYVTLSEVSLDLVPDDVPKVLVGVRGPKSLAVSGRVADGTILAEPAGPEYVHAAREQINAAGPHDVVAYNIGVVDSDSAAALSAARSGLTWIGEHDWEPHIAPLAFAADLRALRARCDSPESFARQLPDEWVRQLAIAGTAEQASERVEALFASGVTSVVLTPVGSHPWAALESLAVLVGRP